MYCVFEVAWEAYPKFECKMDHPKVWNEQISKKPRVITPHLGSVRKYAHSYLVARMNGIDQWKRKLIVDKDFSKERSMVFTEDLF